MPRKSRKKQAEIQKTRSDKTPAWIAAADLYDSEWMSTSKLQIKAMTRPEINDLKTRVLGVLLIHSFGFEAEIGVVMRQLKRGEAFETNPALVRKYPPNRDGSTPVTEVMTSDSVATKLVEYALDGYEESGFAVSAPRMKELKKERQQMRKVLESLEAEGRIERARLNCPAQQLQGLGYESAVKGGLLTPLHTMTDPNGKPSIERKRLGGRRGAVVGVFLLARPKPAQTYGQRISVAGSDYSEGENANAFNGDKAEQLLLCFAEEFGVTDPKILEHPEVQRAAAKYRRVQRNLKRDEEALKKAELEMRGAVESVATPKASAAPLPKQEALFPAPATPSASLNPNASGAAPPKPEAVKRSDAEPPLVSQPRNLEAHVRFLNLAAVSNDAGLKAEAFNDELCRRFHSVNANVPTRKQTDAIFAQLGDKAQGFLDWLTAAEMGSRRPRHGGVLPLFLEEFLKVEAHVAAKWEKRREPTREENLEYLRREWPNMSEVERAEYATAFPELAGMVRFSAAGD